MKMRKQVALIFASTVLLGLVGCAQTDTNHAARAGKHLSTAAGGAQAKGVETGQVSGMSSNAEHALEDRTSHFPFDSSMLSQRDKSILNAHAAYLKSTAGKDQHITIQGHTDERGSAEYNLALGERRANAVKNYLVAQGVNPNQISVVSYGSQRPVNSASNKEAWAENRRAVIVPFSDEYGCDVGDEADCGNAAQSSAAEY